jgi:Zn-dependent peptidase ImmA (M78 family)/transcriptional regulator with XRE-family HTH domain
MIKPNLLRWARERSGRSVEALRKRFPALEAWEQGQSTPTFKQVESLAKVLYVPVGSLFLSEPPEERLPIPDMRTIGSQALAQPSPDLLEVLYLCQRRQAWYREYARSMTEEPFSYVGSVTFASPIQKTADEIRHFLHFDLVERQRFSTWTDALRRFIAQAENAGVLVMVSGVVGSNNRRKLKPEEFRGFALADDLAPLIFINGSDTKAAQMFTLAHELAHIWLGQSALSDVSPYSMPSSGVERWCNQVAAELLVPLQILKDALPSVAPMRALQDLARQFKVSTLVILRRILDAGRISGDVFETAYTQEFERLQGMSTTTGGDFYLSQEARASRRFVKALVVNTLEGQTLYRDAFQLLGIKKEKTFIEFGQRMGVRF